MKIIFVVYINAIFWSISIQPLYAQLEITYEKEEHVHRLDGQLSRIYKTWQTDRRVLAKKALQALGAQTDQSDRIKVVLVPESGKQSSTIDASAFMDLHVDIFLQSRYLMEVMAPVASLEKLTKVQGVGFVRLPFVPSLNAVVTEGYELIQASNYSFNGFTGKGVKVGVIDIGFAGVPNLQAQGELPNLQYRDFTRTGIFSGDEVHGAACAEIIHDIAPDAELYLYKVNSLASWELATNTAIQEGIDILSVSLGISTDGIGDGKGVACDFVDDAFANNVLWVNAAGNSARNIATQYFLDTDGDGFHNFTENSNVIWLENVRTGDQIQGLLAWDDGPLTEYNYDLFLVARRLDGSLVVANSSTIVQYQEPPYDGLYFDVSEALEYGFAVAHDQGAKNFRFRLESSVDWHTFKDYEPRFETISVPGDAVGSLTVGALHPNEWLSGSVATYSSRGPTLDGRKKPDLVGPAGVRTLSYNLRPYNGTSAATPHVAGAAALLKSSNPIYYTAKNLYDALTRSVVDMGDFGKDNEYGAGRLDLSLLPTGRPNLSLSLQKLDFGALVSGSEQTLDLGFVNSGNATLVVNDIFTSPSDYQIVPSNFEVPPGRSAKVTITFKPQSLGDRSGTATIVSNLPDLPRIKIPINAQSVVVPPIPEPQISVSNALVAFGSISLGEATTTNRIVMNFGDAPLTINSITSTNNQISIVPNQLTIPAKTSRNISIRYQPSRPGALSSQITINSTDPNSPTFSIPVSGLGLQVSNQTFSVLASVVGQSQKSEYEITDVGLVEIQIHGQQISGAIGFRSQFTYDAAKMEYAGFEIGSGIPNGHSPGPYFPTGEGTVEVMGGAFGSQMSQSDAPLGTVRFRAKEAFDRGSITMQQVRIRRSGAFEVFDNDVVLNFIKKATTGIPSDFDQDGSVGFSDFLAFAASFSSRRGDASFVEAHDLDHSGDIGFSDFIIFAGNFGKS